MQSLSVVRHHPPWHLTRLYPSPVRCVSLQWHNPVELSTGVSTTYIPYTANDISARALGMVDVMTSILNSITCSSSKAPDWLTFGQPSLPLAYVDFCYNNLGSNGIVFPRLYLRLVGVLQVVNSTPYLCTTWELSNSIPRFDIPIWIWTSIHSNFSDSVSHLWNIGRHHCDIASLLTCKYCGKVST